MSDAAKAEFAKFDLDNDGFISADEIRQVNAALGHDVTPEDVEAMIRAADQNSDGQISLEEFLALTARGRHATG